MIGYTIYNYVQNSITADAVQTSVYIHRSDSMTPSVYCWRARSTGVGSCVPAPEPEEAENWSRPTGDDDGCPPSRRKGSVLRPLQRQSQLPPNRNCVRVWFPPSYDVYSLKTKKIVLIHLLLDSHVTDFKPVHGI